MLESTNRDRWDLDESDDARAFQAFERPMEDGDLVEHPTGMYAVSEDGDWTPEG